MKTSSASLKERLSDWRLKEYAAYELGVCLGLWGDFGAPINEDAWHGLKDIFYTKNPLGDSLYNTLMSLVESQVLIYNQTSFIWNSNYQVESKYD